MVTTPTSTVVHPEWTRSATLYEVNVRQYTQEGTFKAFQAHLPRLQKMGISILWFMPIHPIGVPNRKGTLGSYYAASDYKAVGPEYGTLEDFKAVVKEAHERGMKVIIDWVANHTGWDHVWTKDHLDWFKTNEAGELTSFEYDNGKKIEYWTDVIGLDYSKPELWDAMIDCLKFWVEECDIDGYRCDVAGIVPMELWNRARRELEAIKQVFMLAEWSEPEMHEAAFDMTYDWPTGETLRAIAKGKENVTDLLNQLEKSRKTYPADAYQMKFTTNHDLNSWEGSDVEFYGAAEKTFATLSFLLPGMPLIYSGQEAGLDKRLEFFEKDPIDWKTFANEAFYTDLIAMKTNHPALQAGSAGGAFEVLEATTESVLAFRRSIPGDTVEAIFNLSNMEQEVEGVGTLGPWDYVLKL